MGGVLLVCVAACLWGTVGVASALMSVGAAGDPAAIGLVRTALGALSLLLAARLLRLPRPAWGQVPVGALLLFGLSGAAFQVCLFEAFREVGVTVTVAVTVCAPVLLVVAGDAVRRRAAPERGELAAIALGATGVVLALPVRDPGEAAWAAGLYGGALLAGASVAFAALAVATRTITRQLEPIRTAGLGLAASAAALAVVLALETGSASLASVVAAPGWDLAVLLYIGVAATGAAYLAFVLGMHLCSSASAGLAATMIEPGVAALLAALVLRERLTPGEIAGCLLMMSAMGLLSLGERSKRSRRRAEAT